MNYLWIIISIFFITLTINLILIKFNILIDNDKISVHKNFVKKNSIVPFSGGLIILIALIFFTSNDYLIIKFFLVAIFLLGLFSDLRLIISPIKRLFMQIIIIFFFLYFSKVFITSLNIDFFDYLLNINYVSFALTLFCLLILINGSNFIDGVNTLAIGYYLLISLVLFYLFKKYNFNLDIHTLLVFLLSLSTLFLFNFFGKLYLGDNGSYLIAFFMGINLIELVNNNNFISPYFVALLLWYPAYENFFSIIRKQVKKIPASSPDNCHFHHLLFVYLNKGIKNKKISNTLTGISINLYNALIFIIAVNYYSQTKIMIILLAANLLVYSSLYFLLNKNVYKS